MSFEQTDHTKPQKQPYDIYSIFIKTFWHIFISIIQITRICPVEILKNHSLEITRFQDKLLNYKEQKE